MNRKSARAIAVALLMTMASGSMARAASTTRVVTLGENLSLSQQNAMMRYFGVGRNRVRILYVNHGEEESLLSGVAPASQIGTRSISSSSVTAEPRGYGIQVSTYHITWVTSAMYANALATAGVKNARIAAAAPFPVSGTAALAGILMAYQSASGVSLTTSQQRTAAQEMETTGQLGDALHSKAKATALVLRIKKLVVSDHLTTAVAIRPVVVREAQALSIHLTSQQITQITNLMISISHLALDASSLNRQLSHVEAEVAVLAPPGFWSRLSTWVSSLWKSLTRWV